MRILDFSDGYESSVAPTQSFAVSTSLRSFASDAAYVTAKGAAASEGDIYHNSTSDQIKYHDGSAWREVVSASGTQTIGGDKTFSDNVVVTGNFTVNGTVTTVNTATLDVEDANITINKGGNQTTANSSVSGLTVEMTDATDARVGYDSTLASKWKAGEVGSEVEVATVSHTQTLTNKTISGSSNTLSNIARSSLATGSNYRLLSTNGSGAVQDAAAITASRILVSDANGIPTHSALTEAGVSAKMGLIPTASKTSGYSAVNGDFVRCDASGGTFAVTLPTATAGHVVAIKKTDSSFTAVSITGTIDGVSGSAVHTQGETLFVVGNGTDWETIDRYIPSGGGTYTPTMSAWSTNATASGIWSRDRRFIDLSLYISLSGAPTGTLSTLSLPSGLTFSSTFIPAVSTGFYSPFLSTLRDNGSGTYQGVAYPTRGATTVALYALDASVNGASITATAPFTWASGDTIAFYCRGPIDGWNG